MPFKDLARRREYNREYQRKLYALGLTTQQLRISGGLSRRRRAEMDMRLGVEPVDVIYRRHCEFALSQCGGNVKNAADLLGIGRATLYRHLSVWEREGPCPPSPYAEPPQVVKNDRPGRPASENPFLEGWPDEPTPKSLARRRHVERLLDSNNGSITDTAKALRVARHHLDKALVLWREADEERARKCARSEGIHPKEIDVIFGRCMIEEYAAFAGMSTTTCYQMIDEALFILGLRRSGSKRLMLAPEKSKEDLDVQLWRVSPDPEDEIEVEAYGG